MITVHCEACGKEKQVKPYRAASFRYCSYECRGKRSAIDQAAHKSHRWLGGKREKVCQHCGVVFQKPRRQAVITFEARKFCSKACADKGGFRRSGEDHPSWKANSRRKSRCGKHGSWARAVLERDKATCQHCGATDVELHAHHIKPFETYPELRWELSNGLTLCHTCHWAVHTGSTANRVNSGNIRPGNAEDNPEPSFGRKPIEGVTTRGRAYRRWNGECEWCGQFISKRWSDVVGKRHLFCSKSCAGKFSQRSRGHGGNTPTSALPERDDIV